MSKLNSKISSILSALWITTILIGSVALLCWVVNLLLIAIEGLV